MRGIEKIYLNNSMSFFDIKIKHIWFDLFFLSASADSMTGYESICTILWNLMKLCMNINIGHAVILGFHTFHPRPEVKQK